MIKRILRIFIFNQRKSENLSKSINENKSDNKNKSNKNIPGKFNDYIQLLILKSGKNNKEKYIIEHYKSVNGFIKKIYKLTYSKINCI